MRLLNVHYTKQQVLADIKSIAELREEDIKLPLAVIKREEPEAYKKAYHKFRTKTSKYKKPKKSSWELYCKKQKNKQYLNARRKAFYILKEKHREEFDNILKELKEDIILIQNENSTLHQSINN